MTAKYEVWLTDDAGRRIGAIDKFSTLSYNRTTHGFSTCQLILPYEKFWADFGYFPRPDMRIDVWRSADGGIPARREGSFLIRKPGIYQRTTDNVKMLEIYARSPLDFLSRQHYRGSNTTISGSIDDLMKSIVRSRFTTTPDQYSTSPVIYNGIAYSFTGEFAVDPDSSDGPVTSGNYYLRNVLDILNDLKKESFKLNDDLSTSARIYFDVIEDESLTGNGFGYRFKTFPYLRGANRTNGTIFSTENGNISAPAYYEDYFDAVSSVFLFNSSADWVSQSGQSQDQYLSRWNYSEEVFTTGENNSVAAIGNINTELRDKKFRKSFSADFLNSPGSNNQPRSLYGVDWDMGDLLPCKFGGQVFNAEVAIVYIGVNEKGEENITGKTTVGTQ